MTSKDTSKPSTTIEAQVDKFLARTCEHKGCKLAVCNHARNNLLKAIEAEKLKGQIEEINLWFKMPEHYPGEEYRDEPFAKVRCQVPGRVQYTTLDQRYTYALLTRIQSLQQQLGKLQGGDDE